MYDLGVFITLHIGGSRLYLDPFLPKDLARELQKELRYHPKGYQYSPAYKRGGWDGWIQSFLLRDQSAPNGCYSRIRKFLESKGHEVSFDFLNECSPKGEIKVEGLPGPLDKDQLKAINNAVEHKIGILDAVIRSGKTAIMAGILSKVSRFPAWVVTYSDKSLVRQVRDRLEEHLEMPIGMFYGGQFKEEDVIVTHYSALSRLFKDPKKKVDPDKKTKNLSQETEERNRTIRESIKDAKVLILDECQYAFSKKSRIFINEFTGVGYKIGLSGTPKPDGVTRKEVESVIGPTLSKIRFKTMIEKGRLAQPIVFIYDLPVRWYRAHLSEYADVYNANIVENYYRNKFIKQLVDYLWKKKKTSLVMVRIKAHGEILQELMPKAVYIYGDVKDDTRKILYDRLERKELPCIISTVGKVGLDLPRLDAVINAEGLEASTITIQKMRSLTSHKDKEVGIVMDFVDKGLHLSDHAASRVRKYYSLKGFKIKEKKVSHDHFKD